MQNNGPVVSTDSRQLLRNPECPDPLRTRRNSHLLVKKNAKRSRKIIRKLEEGVTSEACDVRAEDIVSSECVGDFNSFSSI